jgi:hypothetical protein
MRFLCCLWFAKLYYTDCLDELVLLKKPPAENKLRAFELSVSIS